jgi:heterodisulfide reductase subunit A-like polyferredoxin
MMLRALLTRAKSLNAVEIYNADLVARLSGRLGIHAVRVEQTPHMAEDDICQPLLASE